ncbi:hypothetical protein O3M35_007230 [Rhynocoris fuscipes]|uniref:E3 ubiquitin-protein ligase CHFR n=1 Tax=Rhynocoris fuscipes TaxID=488301 RepID=A0AAW1D9H0_9HEMI
MSVSKGPVLYDCIKCVSHPFGDKTQFKIGRNENSCLDILSKRISRNQCVIELNEDKEWVIKDLSSFNTTLVNGKQILKETTVLKDGDKISFQVYQDSEFIFQANPSTDKSVQKKRKLIKESVAKLGSTEEDEEPSVKRSNPSKSHAELCATLTLERDRLATENKTLREQCSQVNEILEETQKSLESLETEKTNLALKLVDEQAVKNDLIIQMQNYIDQLKEAEIELERLIVEKSNKEVRNPNLYCSSVEYLQMKKDLENARKEVLAKEERLNDVLAEKDILTNNISDLLEQEFSCSVCSEVIYQAISLECRHTFCAKCLATWKLTKKECPVCRTKIKSEVNPLVIDQFIDKLTDLIGGEFKKRRETVREERTSSNSRGTTVSPFRYPQTGRRGNRRRSHNNPTNSRSSNSRRNPLANVAEIVYDYHRGVSGLSDNVMIDLTGGSRHSNGRR